MSIPRCLLAALLITIPFTPAAASEEACLTDGGLYGDLTCQVERDPADVQGYLAIAEHRGPMAVEAVLATAEAAPGHGEIFLWTAYEIWCGPYTGPGCPETEAMVVGFVVFTVDHADTASMRFWCDAGAGRLTAAVCAARVAHGFLTLAIGGADRADDHCRVIVGAICPDLPDIEPVPQEPPLCAGAGHTVGDARCDAAAVADDADATSRQRILLLLDTRDHVTGFGERAAATLGDGAERETARQAAIVALLLGGAGAGDVVAAECTALAGEAACADLLG